MSSKADQHILAAAQISRSKALELAFEQYWELLFRHAHRKLQSDDLAKDVVQEVFIVMWENIDMLKTQQELLPYLYGVMRNKILSHYKKDSVRLKYAVDQALKHSELEPSSHQLLLNKELQQIIDDEIEKMPSRMREIYDLQKQQHKTIKEIAEILGISEQTIKNQLQNASGRLKSRLINYDSTFLQLGMILAGLHYLSK